VGRLTVKDVARPVLRGVQNVLREHGFEG